MERKQQRWYQLQIETNDVPIITNPDGSKRIDPAYKPNSIINNVTITHPITLEFEVVRNNMASANNATFTIYNLNSLTRNRIFRDPFAMQDRRAIQFTAGYKDGTETLLGLVFSGEMRSALSFRRGVNWVTEIECYDGTFGMQNGNVSLTIGKGANKGEVFDKLVELMPGVKGPVRGNILETIKRGVTLMGNVGQIMKDLAAGDFSIDNGTAYVLKDNECIEGDVKIIKAESGLIGVPRRAKNFIEFDMVFEPRLKVGQMVKLTSDLSNSIGTTRTKASDFTGEYKITGLTHRGTISGAVCEDAITTVSAIFDPNLVMVSP